MDKVETVKKVIEPNISLDCSQLYFDLNVVGDKTYTLYNDEDVTVFVCYDNGYFEVLGLTLKEEDKLVKWFDKLVDKLINKVRLNDLEQMEI